MNQLIFENPEALALAAVQSFRELALEAIEARGRFNVALAGGSTPKIIYEKLATLALPWENIHLFWGDERLVPHTDSKSNYRMVQEAMLEKISIPPENIHAVQMRLEPEMTNYLPQKGDHKGLPYKNPLAIGDKPLPFTDNLIEKILGAYAAELEKIQFDLVHLGLGTDGHTASIFPASNLETEQPVQITFPTAGLEPQVQRISLSLAKINAARVKQFFVTGKSKQAILQKISSGEDYPAARVENAMWWLG